MGGIGLADIPKKPKVYLTGNSKDIVKKYSTKNIQNNLYGVVGPIVGVSGLLIGLAATRKMKAACYLAETYGHPMYLGIKGAKELVAALNAKLQLGINVDKLDKEIAKVDEDIMKRTEELAGLTKQAAALNKLKGKMTGEASYIG